MRKLSRVFSRKQANRNLKVNHLHWKFLRSPPRTLFPFFHVERLLQMPRQLGDQTGCLSASRSRHRQSSDPALCDRVVCSPSHHRYRLQKSLEQEGGSPLPLIQKDIPSRPSAHDDNASPQLPL